MKNKCDNPDCLSRRTYWRWLAGLWLCDPCYKRGFDEDRKWRQERAFSKAKPIKTPQQKSRETCPICLEDPRKMKICRYCDEVHLPAHQRQKPGPKQQEAA